MATNHQPFSNISGYSSFKPIGQGGFGTIYKTPKTLIAGTNVTLVETPTTTTISAIGGGGGVSRYVDLTDVQVATTPIPGAVTMYSASASKWVQTPAITHNAAGDDKIALTTTGAVAILSTGGSVGIQATAGEIAIASAGDASLTSAVGNTNITSLVNTVAITAGNAITATAVGGIQIESTTSTVEILAELDLLATSAAFVQIQAGNDISITTTGAGKTINLNATQLGSAIILASPEIYTSIDDCVTINLQTTGVSTFSGHGSTEIGIENSGSTTNIRGDEINVVMSQTGAAFVAQSNVDSILTIETENKTAAQYSLDIATHPEAIPNVQFVLDTLSGDNSQDVRVGGQAPASTLTFGTTNTQDISVIKNSNAVFGTTTVPADKTYVKNQTGGGIDVIADASIIIQAVTGSTIISGDAGVRLSSPSDQVTITAITTEIQNSIGVGTFAFFNSGELKSLTPGYETIMVGNNAIPNKKYVDDAITSTALTLSNKSLVDASTFIIDEIDATKRVKFQVAGLTTGTTRTLTFPDLDGTLVTNNTSVAQGGNLFGTAMQIGTNDNFDVIIRRNNLQAYNFGAAGITMLPQGGTTAFSINAPSGVSLAGSLTINAGTATSAVSTAGGNLILNAGNGQITGGTSVADGGSVTVNGGTGIRRPGGDVRLVGGYANDGAVVTTGGSVVLTSGRTASVGKCGDILLEATSSALPNISPGNVWIRCNPQSGTGNRPGGVITIAASPAIGAGAPGYLRLFYTSTLGFTIEGDGTLSTNTPAYESLITLDNDIPNRKYVEQLTSPYAELAFGGDNSAAYQYVYTLANTFYEILPPLALLDSNNSSFLVSGAKFSSNGGGRLKWLGPSAVKAKLTYTLSLSTSGGNGDAYEFQLSKTTVVTGTPDIITIVPIVGTLIQERMIVNNELQMLTFAKQLTLNTGDNISIIARSSGTGRIMSVPYFSISVSIDKQYR